MSRTHEHNRAPSLEATVAMGTSLSGQGLPLPSVAGGRAVGMQRIRDDLEAKKAAEVAQGTAKALPEPQAAKTDAGKTVDAKGKVPDEPALQANAGEMYESHIRMIAAREGEVSRKGAATMSLAQLQASLGDSKKPVQESNEWMKGWDKSGIGGETFKVSSVSLRDTGNLPPPANNVAVERSGAEAVMS